jgi:hypothetical protein
LEGRKKGRKEEKKDWKEEKKEELEGRKEGTLSILGQATGWYLVSVVLLER